MLALPLSPPCCKVAASIVVSRVFSCHPSVQDVAELAEAVEVLKAGGVSTEDDILAVRVRFLLA